MTRPRKYLAIARFTYPQFDWWVEKDGDIFGNRGIEIKRFDLNDKNVQNALFDKLRKDEHGGWKIQQMKGYWRATNITIDKERGEQMEGLAASPTLLELVSRLVPGVGE